MTLSWFRRHTLGTALLLSLLAHLALMWDGELNLADLLERDAAKRKKMYEDMQAEFRQTSPFIMLFQQVEVAAMRTDVKGLKMGPTSDTTYMFNVSK